jgi:ketosteroid isomerase-like protein
MKPGKDAAARQYMTALRDALPTLPIALCSFRFPSYQPNFPWKAFLEKCDLNMPQVYWVEAHNAGSQLDRCIREFKAMTPFRPVIPTGIACYEGSWYPTESDITQFLDTARTLNLAGANFWDWEESRKQLPKVFDVIAKYTWPNPSSQIQDISQVLIDAMNSHNVNKVVALYDPKAVHINATRTVQGTDALKTWYTDLFQKVLPDASFTLTGSTGAGNSRHFTWLATSTRGPVNDGSDTLGLVGADSIAYHYTSFTPPAATV